MAARRPLVNVAGSLRELPTGDTVQGVAQWFFGTGVPSDEAGAPADYYVASDNKLWQKGATTWTYTGVQYGALGAVPAKTTPVDADVLSLGDSANGFQMAKLTLANLRTFLGGGVGYRSVTAATTLAASDAAKIIDCSGTWTLGFAAAATLGAGWWCYVRNVGTGTITADPNGSELIDGVVSGTILPGMTLLVQCDGTAFRCMRVGPMTRTDVITSGTSRVVPLGVRSIRMRGVGGGGGGGYGSDRHGAAGASGGYFEGHIAVVPGDTLTYAIGAGGAPGPSTNTSGSAGGQTVLTARSVTYTGAGGPGGLSSPSITAGGAASGAPINIQGGPGISTIIGIDALGIGGNNALGQGSARGQLSTGYGAGGCGGHGGNDPQAGRPGVLILEY